MSEAAHKVQESLETSTVGVGDTEEDASRRRHRVRELFQAMDKDHNGKLDVGEFRGISGVKMQSIYLSMCAGICLFLETSEALLKFGVCLLTYMASTHAFELGNAVSCVAIMILGLIVLCDCRCHA